MYQNKNSNKPIDGEAKFVPIVKWYEVMQDLEMRMIDYLEQSNIPGIMTIYRLYYAKWYPYLEKYIQDDLIKFFDLDDIYQLQDQMKPGNTQYETKENNKVYQEIEQLIMAKWCKLKELIARSNLEIPIEKKEWRPAALAGDDW